MLKIISIYKPSHLVYNNNNLNTNLLVLVIQSPLVIQLGRIDPLVLYHQLIRVDLDCRPVLVSHGCQTCHPLLNGSMNTKCLTILGYYIFTWGWRLQYMVIV